MDCDWAEVSRVIDGDTIVVLIDNDEERVRYIGIDTAEIDEPLYAEASAQNEHLLQASEMDVCLERDVSERDRFERLLRYGWLRDGRMLNEALVREGMAVVVTFPPDVKYHESRLLPAQAEARAAGLGVWGE